MRLRSLSIGTACLFVLLSGTPAVAQLRATVLVSGLTLPVGFVQDPSDPTVQYVIEQGGRIKVVRNGTLQSTPFLDLSASIAAGGERGLLGMALSPDYATSGRFYVNFTNPVGDTVVARFKRGASTNPLLADPASRFDLRWSTGERVIRQPFANHNGGNIVFGPDGFLYIGMGDGGSGDDPQNNAQNLSSLLGKMLRIDVSVADSDPAGFRIPANNPFIGVGAPEIWDIGVRNPWRWSFDDPSRGGTGALVIGDVGQNRFEEVDYEPAGAGGKNYGWRNREGAHDEVTTIPIRPDLLPLTEPIFEYSHTDGASITGGFVYRGAAMPAFRGRYFFADFVFNRVWSIALTINPANGTATASDLREHSADLGSPGITSFGVDAAGELYFTNYGAGTISRISSAAPASTPALQIDTPANGSIVSQPFLVAGWALDRGSATSPAIDAIHVWAFPTSGAAPQFVGATTVGVPRPDVAAVFGSQFAAAGYGLFVRGLAPGGYRLIVFGLVHATGDFTIATSVNVQVARTSRISIDLPANNATVNRPFIVTGWAIDSAAPSGTGIDTIHVWGVPVAPAGAPVFLGVASFGNRADVAAAFGAQFTPSGYGLIANPPAAGVWDIVVFPHSTVSGAFEPAGVVRVTVR